MSAPVQGGLTKAQKNTIRRAAEALEGLGCDLGTAGDLRNILASQSAAPVTASDDIEARTERIRLSHANSDSKGKIQLRHEVECLLAHIALLRSTQAAELVAASGSAQPASLPLADIRKVCMSHWINRDSGDLSTEQLAHNAAISRCLGALKALATQAATVTGAQAGASDAALKFSDHIINGMFEGGDWDGGGVQELAVKYGLLKLEEQPEPCGESCQCAQNGAEFPSICYRKTYLAAIKAMAPVGAKP